jgi:hypothetical protein
MCYEDEGFYRTAVETLYYRQDLFYLMDVFKGGPGKAQWGNRAQVGGHKWEGNVLALRAGGGYGTKE